MHSCNPDQGFSVPNNGGGYQMAKTGGGYVGLHTINGLNQNKRNYIQTKLLDSLYLGHSFYVEFFVSTEDHKKYASNNIGLLFTKTSIYVDTIAHPYGVLSATPQILNYSNPIIIDTMNWVKVSGVYVAQGGEQFITIGNFKTDAQTSYKQIQPTGYNGAGYYIDDVSVYALDSFCLKADAGKDITIQQGDSAFIGSYTNGIDSIMWLENGITPKDSTHPGFYIHPNNNSFYVLRQTVNGCFSSDTVYVNVLLPLKFTNYTLRFTNSSGQFPSNGGVRGGLIENIWITTNETNVSHFNIQRSANGKDFTTIGKVAAQNKITNEYQYTDDGQQSTVDGGLSTIYYRIKSIDFDGRKQYSTTQQINIQLPTLSFSPTLLKTLSLSNQKTISSK